MTDDDQALADLRALEAILAAASTATTHPTYVIIHNRATAEVLGLGWDATPSDPDPTYVPDATPEQNAAYIEELDRYVSRPTRDWEK